ncbi:MAG TPA: S8 family serine peptidase [Blastocatellia bacterium]|nr:S8 family serine peptidase [Blastocatellia bacterium]
MRISRLPITVVALSLALAIAGFVAFRASAQSPLTSVIVELKGDPVVVAQARAKAAGRSFDPEAYRQTVITEQQQFLTNLTLAGVPYTISSVSAPNGPVTPTLQFRFNYVFNGITLEVPEQTLPIFDKFDDVLAVLPNSPVAVHLDHAVDYTRAPLLYGNPPKLTQFDTLNTGGLEGDGVNIAVVDTGVDWSHDMFGGDPTPPQFGVAGPVAALNTNKKVIYYMNFTAGSVGIGDDFGHGTHVAADCAGYRGFAPGPDGIPLTADDIPIHGVAPQAKIMAYKALTGAGTGLVASIVACIEDAVQPRTITGQPKPVAHIINLSLGGSGNEDSADSIACDNAALAGVTVVASAGNSGVGTPDQQSKQLGTVGDPAAGRRVIAVGANIDPGAGPNNIDVFGGTTRTPPVVATLNAFMMDGSAPLTADITNNYVNCYFADTPDQVPDSVSGKIALIQRGSTVNDPTGTAGTGLFSNKAAIVAAKGAVAALIYNNVNGELTSGTVRKSIIPTFGLSKASGEYLKANLGSTTPGAVSVLPIRINRALIFNPAMADFSSRGPLASFGQVKPDVTNPGVAILSATVAVGGAETNTATMFDPTRYISASGTSFSGPITAGCAALIKQKHPDWGPSQIRAALVNTATNLRQSSGAPIADGANSINDQGGGLVDAYAAANAKALMGVGQPAPAGQPQGRTFGILTQPSAGNPDFTPSYSFGAVPIANVIGSATISQTMSIYDVANGGGAGTYQLAVVPVRNVDGSGFKVSTTDANGNPISSVTLSGASASFNVKTEANGLSLSNPTQAQWYIVASRTDGGQRLRMPFYYRAVRPDDRAFAAPTLAPASGNEVSGNPPIDIDGSYTLQYSYSGSPAPAQFRIEQQTVNLDAQQNKVLGPVVVLSDVPAGQTSFAISGRGNGWWSYKVAGLFAVTYGLLQGPDSGPQEVQVNRRIESDVTSMIQTAMSNVAFGAGVFEFDWTLKNASSTTILPPLRSNIIAIQSNTGTVRASNADNGGNGVESSATWDYSNTLGSDRALTPGETSGARHLKFSDPASEMFTFTTVIRGNFPDPAFSSMSLSGGGGGRKFRIKLRFLADPSTLSVTLLGAE